MPRHRKARPLVLIVSFAVLAVAIPLLPPAAHAQESDASIEMRSDAYYHFSLAHLYQQLARQYQRADYLNKSKDEFDAAIKADPDSTYLRVQRAELLALMSRVDDSIEELEAVLEEDDQNVAARELLANIYWSLARSARGSGGRDMIRKAATQHEKLAEIEPDNIQHLLNLARAQRNTGDVDAAAETYEDILKKEPESEEALGALARIYTANGEPEKALALLEKVRETGSATPPQLVALAEAYQGVGEFNEAAELLEQALEAGGDVLDIRKQLAQALAMADEFDKAVEQYERIVRAQPNDPEMHLRLSQVYRQQRKFEDAHKSLDRAQELAPNAPEVLYNRALLYEAQGETDQSIESMEDLLDETVREEYSPQEAGNRAMFLMQLGLLHRQKEDYESAVRSFRRAAVVQPEGRPRAYAQIVETYRQARDSQEALSESKRALEEYPDDLNLAVQRANVLSENGQIDDAAKLLSGFLEDDTEDRLVRQQLLLSLAQVHEKGKQYDDAVTALETAESLAKTDSERIGILFAGGSVLERAKRFDASEEKFRALLALDPENAGALNYLGYMLADRGERLDEAHDMIQRALDLEPDNGAYLDSLGWVYFRQGKFELAERYLVRSLEQFGKDPVVHSHLADVYFALDRIDDAKKHWERSLAEYEASPAADRDQAEMKRIRGQLDAVSAP